MYAAIFGEGHTLHILLRKEIALSCCLATVVICYQAREVIKCCGAQRTVDWSFLSTKNTNALLTVHLHFAFFREKAPREKGG
jgi:hypothetical protein